MRIDTTLLGKEVLPLVKRTHYQAANCDTDGNLNYLSGDDRIRYANRVVDKAVQEQKRINKEQTWTVWSIHADGKFNLLSDFGYWQENVRRSDFRLKK